MIVISYLMPFYYIVTCLMKETIKLSILGVIDATAQLLTVSNMILGGFIGYSVGSIIRP